MSGFDGNWALTLHVPQGDQQVALEFDSAGPRGSMTVDGTTSDLTDLALDGSNGTWRANLTQPMPIVVEFSADIEGDTMTGIATAASIIKMPFEGTRS